MFKLDANLLRELGLGDLPPDEQNLLLSTIYERLEQRTGQALAEQMSEAQLDEFELFIDNDDEEGALSWLERNFPQYREIVAAELELLKHEVAEQADEIRRHISE